MQIIRDSNYIVNLDIISDFIAKDSISRALNFLEKLDDKIDNIVHMPYKYRKSLYYENKNVRDMIFKGYTIPYMINTQKNNLLS